MKRFFCLILLIFVQNFYSQVSNHTVKEGETISKIAIQYKVTPFDLYKLNPDAQSGIKPGMVLLIPKSVVVSTPKEVSSETKTPSDKNGETKQEVVNSSSTKPNIKPTTSSNTQFHKVKPKETLYTISKLYNVSIEEIEQNNPIIKEKALQPGQELVIKKGINTSKPQVNQPSKTPTETAKPKVVVTTNQVIHDVQPKETKYGIATKYGITVEELENQNPEIKDNLPIGFQLKINKNSKSASVKSEKKEPVPIKENTTKPKQEPVVEKPKQEVLKATQEPIKPKQEPAKVNETVSSSTNGFLNYTVKDGDTFYSLTRTFKITQEKLIEMNPALAEGLKEGMVLKVPADITINATPYKPSTDLFKTISKTNKKHLALLIPFNISKIEMDTVKSLNSKFKDDKFLNMTLDFYSGVLMAIDSAKVLGLNIEVSIFDSEETKTSTTAVETLQNKAQNVDVVIGPFFQSNVEKVAQSLESKKIPVISPLSKEVSATYSNLYNSMPSAEPKKKAIFDYMNDKNGAIIALVEPEETEISDFIKNNYKNTKWVELSPKKTFVGDSIKKHFVKDKTNFVVMESEKYYTIQTTIATMIASMKEYNVQLVILEPNEMLDFEEISLNNLIKLKLTYPSLNRDNETVEASDFEKAYRKKNKVLPNQFATRGFDLTFDTMLRLSQEKSFEQTIQTMVSEQVENKFDYSKNLSGGYINNGVYILSYYPDFTIKQAQ